MPAFLAAYPLVSAAIIGGGASVAGTAIASRANSKANQRATTVEDRRIAEATRIENERIAEATRIEDKRIQQAIDREKELEARRQLEVDRQFDEEKRQWDETEAEFAPYQQASMGALGSMQDLLNSLGGRGGKLDVGALLNGAPRPQGGGGPQRPVPTGPPASSGGPWRPAETVRTGRPGALSAGPSGARQTARPTATNANGQAITSAANHIADIVRQLSARTDATQYPGLDPATHYKTTYPVTAAQAGY